MVLSLLYSDDKINKKLRLEEEISGFGRCSPEFSGMGFKTLHLIETKLHSAEFGIPSTFGVG